MPADPVAVSLLEKARKSRDDLEARLLLAAAVQRVASGLGIQAVVVGGTAVDFYAAGAAGTSAGYPAQWQASGDIDVVALAVNSVHAADRELKEALQRDLGFEPHRMKDAGGRELLGRALIVPGFGYGLEIVDDQLRGDPRAEKVFTVEVDGQPVIFRGPEDTIISYGESGWHFRHAREWERALAVFRAMRGEVDMNYLRQRARERRMPGVLEEIIAQRPLPPQAGPMF